MVSTPNKYPASEEKTTLNANRILVISLKSDITDVAFNGFLFVNVLIT